MRFFAAVLGAVLIALHHGGAVLAAPSDLPSLQEVTEGVARREALLSQSRWEFAVEIRDRADGPAYDRQTFLLHRKGRKLRFACSQPANAAMPAADVTVAWDGQVQTVINEVPKRAVDRRHSGVILGHMGNSFRVEYWPTFLEFSLGDARCSLGELLADAKWEVTGIRTIDGQRAVGIKSITPVKRPAGNTITAWLALDRDYAPLIYEETLKFDDAKRMPVSLRLQNVKLVQVSDVWVIKQAEIELIEPDSPPPAGHHNWKRQFELSRFSRDPENADDFYRLKFPVGTQVADDVRKAAFIAGKAVILQIPDGSVRFAPFTAFPDLDAWTDYSKGISAADWDSSDSARAVKLNWATVKPDGSLLDYAREASTTQRAAIASPAQAQARPSVDYLLSAGALGCIVAGVLLLRRGKPRADAGAS